MKKKRFLTAIISFALIFFMVGCVTTLKHKDKKPPTNIPGMIKICDYGKTENTSYHLVYDSVTKVVYLVSECYLANAGTGGVSVIPYVSESGSYMKYIDGQLTHP